MGIEHFVTAASLRARDGRIDTLMMATCDKVRALRPPRDELYYDLRAALRWPRRYRRRPRRRFRR